MPKKRGLYDYIFTLAAGGLYVFSVSLSVAATTVIAYTRAELFITGFIALLVLMLVFYNRYTALAALALAAAAAVFIWLLWTDRAGQYKEAEELILMARGRLAYRAEYDKTVLRLLCWLAGLLAAVFSYARFSFYPLAISGAVPFMITHIMNYKWDALAFPLFLVSICLFWVKKMNVKNNGGSAAALVSLPFCAAAVFMAGLLPVNIEPFAGQALTRFFTQPIQVVGDWIFTAFNPKYFSFQTTGFTHANNQLGGPVSPNSREVMRVDAAKRLYLSGATKDYYTGRSWEDRVSGKPFFSPDINANEMEYKETASVLALFDLYRWGAEGGPYAVQFGADVLFTWDNAHYLNMDGRNISIDLESVLRWNGASIHIGGNRTGTLFKPLKYYEWGFAQDQPQLEEDLSISAAGDLKLSGLMARDTEYGYRFLDLDKNNPVIRHLLHQAKTGFYQGLQTELAQKETADVLSHVISAEEWLAGSPPRNMVQMVELYAQEASVFPQDMAPVQIHFNAHYATRESRLPGFQDTPVPELLAFLPAMVSYAGYVRENYTQLPASVPARVRELAAEIAQNGETDYQRVQAVADYLLDIPYTLTPGTVPDGADFVDYFLFERREGYCVYYASAMAVLLRCMDIPARYVEGYLLPPEKTDGLYVVTNRQAHAWVEVYLEGYGWLTVEATAPYNRSLSHAAADAPLTASGNMGANYYEDYRQNGMDQPFTPPAQAAEGNARRGPVMLFNGMIPLGQALAAGSVLLVLLLVLLATLVQYIRESLRFRHVSRLSANEQAQIYYWGLVKLTSYFYPAQKGETPRMYGRRLRKRFAFRSDRIVFGDLVELYYKAQYGTRALREDELADMQGSYNEMIELIRGARGTLRFYYLRFVRRITVL